MPIKPSGLPEYPGVRRLRHRRLLTYLRLQGLYPAFQSMIPQTDAHMCEIQLQRLVAGGLLSGALDYVGRFLPPDGGGGEARALISFLQSFGTFTNIVAGANCGAVTASAHRHDICIGMGMSRNAKLFAILDGMLKSPKFRDSLNWELVRYKASAIAREMAREAPELRRRMQLPDDPLAPHDVLPIGPRRRSHAPSAKWTPGRPPPEKIAKLYLNKRRSLPPPSNQPTGDLLTESLEQAADLIVKCLRACRRPECYQVHTDRSSWEASFQLPPLSTLVSPFWGTT